MSHEIAHIVAKHSVERMSRTVAVTVSTGVTDAVTGVAVSKTGDAIDQVTGVDIVDTTLMRPHGRSEESEAEIIWDLFLNYFLDQTSMSLLGYGKE